MCIRDRDALLQDFGYNIPWHFRVHPMTFSGDSTVSQDTLPRDFGYGIPRHFRAASHDFFGGFNFIIGRPPTRFWLRHLTTFVGLIQWLFSGDSTLSWDALPQDFGYNIPWHFRAHPMTFSRDSTLSQDALSRDFGYDIPQHFWSSSHDFFRRIHLYHRTLSHDILVTTSHDIF